MNASHDGVIAAAVVFDLGGVVFRNAAYREGLRVLGQRLSFENFRNRWISAFEPDPDVVDPRLFRTLLDLLGVAAGQVSYVDDEPANADAAALEDALRARG